MTDHLAMLAAWHAAVQAIRNPPSSMHNTANKVLLMSAEVGIRIRAFRAMPAGPENALALLSLISDFFEFANGDLGTDEMEQARRAGQNALAVLARARRAVA